MAKRKKNLTPEELERVRALVEDVRRDVRAIIELLQAKLGERPA
jgi:hypothetical protein